MAAPDELIEHVLAELWVFEEDERTPWNVGDRVQGYFGSASGTSGAYYGGRVAEIRADGKFSVAFDDGDFLEMDRWEIQRELQQGEPVEARIPPANEWIPASVRGHDENGYFFVEPQEQGVPAPAALARAWVRHPLPPGSQVTLFRTPPKQDPVRAVVRDYHPISRRYKLQPDGTAAPELADVPPNRIVTRIPPAAREDLRRNPPRDQASFTTWLAHRGVVDAFAGAAEWWRRAGGDPLQLADVAPTPASSPRGAGGGTVPSAPARPRIAQAAPGRRLLHPDLRRALQDVVRSSREEKPVQQQFLRFDEDQTGLLKLDAFRNVLRSLLGEEVPEETAAALADGLDVDGDRLVSYREFADICGEAPEGPVLAPFVGRLRAAMWGMAARQGKHWAGVEGASEEGDPVTQGVPLSVARPFEQQDRSGAGFLPVAALRTALSTWNVMPSPDEMRALINAFGSGRNDGIHHQQLLGFLAPAGFASFVQGQLRAGIQALQRRGVDPLQDVQQAMRGRSEPRCSAKAARELVLEGWGLPLSDRQWAGVEAALTENGTSEAKLDRLCKWAGLTLPSVPASGAPAAPPTAASALQTGASDDSFFRDREEDAAVVVDVRQIRARASPADPLLRLWQSAIRGAFRAACAEGSTSLNTPEEQAVFLASLGLPNDPDVLAAAAREVRAPEAWNKDTAQELADVLFEDPQFSRHGRKLAPAARDRMQRVLSAFADAGGEAPGLLSRLQLLLLFCGEAGAAHALTPAESRPSGGGPAELGGLGMDATVAAGLVSALPPVEAGSGSGGTGWSALIDPTTLLAWAERAAAGQPVPAGSDAAVQRAMAFLTGPVLALPLRWLVRLRPMSGVSSVEEAGPALLAVALKRAGPAAVPRDPRPPALPLPLSFMGATAPRSAGANLNPGVAAGPGGVGLGVAELPSDDGSAEAAIAAGILPRTASGKAPLGLMGAGVAGRDAWVDESSPYVCDSVLVEVRDASALPVAADASEGAAGGDGGVGAAGGGDGAAQNRYLAVSTVLLRQPGSAPHNRATIEVVGNGIALPARYDATKPDAWSFGPSAATPDSEFLHPAPWTSLPNAQRFVARATPLPPSLRAPSAEEEMQWCTQALFGSAEPPARADGREGGGPWLLLELVTEVVVDRALQRTAERIVSGGTAGGSGRGAAGLLGAGSSSSVESLMQPDGSGVRALSSGTQDPQLAVPAVVAWSLASIPGAARSPQRRSWKSALVGGWPGNGVQLRQPPKPEKRRARGMWAAMKQRLGVSDVQPVLSLRVSSPAGLVAAERARLGALPTWVVLPMPWVDLWIAARVSLRTALAEFDPGRVEIGSGHLCHRAPAVALFRRLAQHPRALDALADEWERIRSSDSQKQRDADAFIQAWSEMVASLAGWEATWRQQRQDPYQVPSGGMPEEALPSPVAVIQGVGSALALKADTCGVPFAICDTTVTAATPKLGR